VDQRTEDSSSSYLYIRFTKAERVEGEAGYSCSSRGGLKKGSCGEVRQDLAFHGRQRGRGEVRRGRGRYSTTHNAREEYHGYRRKKEVDSERRTRKREKKRQLPAGTSRSATNPRWKREKASLGFCDRASFEPKLMLTLKRNLQGDDSIFAGLCGHFRGRIVFQTAFGNGEGGRVSGISNCQRGERI